MTIRRRHTAVLALVALCSACRSAPEPDPRIVTEWMHTLYGAVRAERVSPAVGSRLFAYATVGMYAGLAAADPSLPRIEGRLNGLTTLPRGSADSTYDGSIAAIAAERTILDSLFRDGLPTTRASLTRVADSLMRTRAPSVDAATQARSVRLGVETAFAILVWSHGDGFDSTRGRKYVLPVGVGMWTNDSAANTFAVHNMSGASQLIDPANPANTTRSGSVSDRSLILDRIKNAGVKTLPAANMAGITEPYWGHNRPFSLTAWNECPAPPALPFSTTAGTPLYEEARAVYEMRQHLTPEQKLTSLYWADNAGESGTPAGHWLSIASEMVGERHLGTAQAAWLMAMTGVSLADAFIVAWGYKFQHNSVRPRAFIRATMDSLWEPAIVTPSFPEYLSGHSTVSAAAAGTLTGALGATAFDDSTSISIGHAVRHYASFTAAADEAGMSRIYGGIHFPYSNREGRSLGRCIASKVLARFDGGKLPESGR